MIFTLRKFCGGEGIATEVENYRCDPKFLCARASHSLPCKVELYVELYGGHY